MQQLLDKLANLSVQDILQFVIAILCFIYSVKVNGLAKTIKTTMEALEKMNYTKPDERPRVAQEFSETVPDYILNPVTNELTESPVPRDVQAEIDSHADCALNVALDKFLPQQYTDSDEIADCTQMRSDLAVMASMYERAEEYREKFGLPDSLSVQQIYEAVGKQADMLAEKLKGVEQNETSQEIVKES